MVERYRDKFAVLEMASFPRISEYFFVSDRLSLSSHFFLRSKLLRGTFPGQFHTVRRNLNNIVVVLDLSRLDSLRFISGPVAQIISRGLPFRFGVVPMLETERCELISMVFCWLIN